MLHQDTQYPLNRSLTFCEALSALRGQWVLMADNNLAIEGGLDVQRHTMRQYYAEPVSFRQEAGRGRFHLTKN